MKPFNAEFFEEVIQRISEGDTLRSICREHGERWQTVYEWMKVDVSLHDRFARARLDGADAIAEETLRIADTPVIGEEVEMDESGKVYKRKKSDMLGHRKLQIETRLQLLAKWFPQKYGHKQQLDIDANVSSSTSHSLTADAQSLLDKLIK